jgi:flagellar hook assembly protein FlgD
LITLEQNYPNPFNPETKINFSLTKDSNEVELSIYNLKGQKVITLHKGEAIKGSYSISWDGKDENHKSAASGIYYYKLTAGKVSNIKKMILMR